MPSSRQRKIESNNEKDKKGYTQGNDFLPKGHGASDVGPARQPANIAWDCKQRAASGKDFPNMINSAASNVLLIPNRFSTGKDLFRAYYDPFPASTHYQPYGGPVVVAPGRRMVLPLSVCRASHCAPVGVGSLAKLEQWVKQFKRAENVVRSLIAQILFLLHFLTNVSFLYF